MRFPQGLLIMYIFQCLRSCITQINVSRQENETLGYLNLENNLIDDNGVDALASMLLVS